MSDVHDDHDINDRSTAESGILLLNEQYWEDGAQVRPCSEPLSFAQWTALLKMEGCTACWTPLGALTDAPYLGSVVVEVGNASGRTYALIPPDDLEALATVMDPDEYAKVQDDLMAVGDPSRLPVVRLERAPWERNRTVVAAQALTLESWAGVIRQHHLQLPSEEIAYLPDGQFIVTVRGVDSQGHYFAVPHAVLPAVIDLGLEMEQHRRTERAPEGNCAVFLPNSLS